MNKKILNQFINTFFFGACFAGFGLGAMAYELKTELFENYYLASLTSIIGMSLATYAVVHLGPKVEEIIKKLK